MHEIATIGSILLLNVVRSYSIVTMMLTICQKSPHRQRTNKLRPKKKNPYQNKSHMLLSKKAPHPQKVNVSVAKITHTKRVSREYPTKDYILG